MASILDELGDFGSGVVAVMVSAVDGVVAVDGKVGALTGSADQSVLLGLRERAAAVIVGAGTVAAEGYDSLLPDDARSRRTARGLPAQPTLCVVARSRDSIAGSGAANATDLDLVISSELVDAAPEGGDDGPPDLGPIVSALRQRAGDPNALVTLEGGPSTLAAALDQRVVTDLVLGVSPVVAAGRHWDASGDPVTLRLRAHAVSAGDGFVFLRYGISA